ncbi:hypothetical protein AVEN_52946-1 [Araneus ventricosus]|uniref:Uncharacterized protein n=1 Tax=Araneus ventricosus TaxID=182803 RepID=A0A4Y2SJZ3_ARAVE|nr:hypothetical protein AVEN_52946-1 [Araneus ventricosus]
MRRDSRDQQISSQQDKMPDKPVNLGLSGNHRKSEQVHKNIFDRQASEAIAMTRQNRETILKIDSGNLATVRGAKDLAM